MAPLPSKRPDDEWMVIEPEWIQLEQVVQVFLQVLQLDVTLQVTVDELLFVDANDHQAGTKSFK